MDLKVILKDKERLCLLSCGVLVLIIVTFFLSSDFAMFLYHYSTSIVLGTSQSKAITILVWLLATFFIGWISLKRRWKVLDFKQALSLFIIVTIALLSLNLVAFNSMVSKAEASKIEKPLITTFNAEFARYIGVSRLEHTHSLKPVLYLLFRPFLNLEEMSYDFGGNLYSLFPKWVFYPALFLTGGYILAYILLVVRAAKKFKGLSSIFNLTVLGLVGVSFFVSFYDGGPLTSPVAMGAAFLSIGLLFNYVQGEFDPKWIPVLVFLPLSVLGGFNLFTYLIANTYPASFESHLIISSFGFLAALIYSYSNKFRYRRVLLAVLGSLLVLNPVTFIPHPWIQNSIKGDDAYILFPTSSISKEEAMKRVNSVQGIENLEIMVEYEHLLVLRGDVTKTGLKTTKLAKETLNKKITPMSANWKFTFAEPEQQWPFTVHLPEDQVSRPQFFDLLMGKIEPFNIKSVKRRDDLIQVNYTSPAGLDWEYFITILHNRVPMNYVIFSRKAPQKPTGELAKDFFFELIPVTSAQIKTYKITG